MRCTPGSSGSACFASSRRWSAPCATRAVARRLPAAAPGLAGGRSGHSRVRVAAHLRGGTGAAAGGDAGDGRGLVFRRLGVATRFLDALPARPVFGHRAHERGVPLVAELLEPDWLQVRLNVSGEKSMNELMTAD